MELTEFLNRVAEDVEGELIAIADEYAAEPERLSSAMRWSLLAGGKRFRPALLIAAGEAFGAGRSSLLRSAAALEMIHTYSLIHDDLPSMDDDELRRGIATCHVKFGEATAILAGDALQAIAFLAIARDPNLQAPVRLNVISELADAAAKMVAGQQMDLDAEGIKVGGQHLEKIHRSKTGALITASAISGALIGGAGFNDLKYLRRYAERLGLLFQITDDLLDVTQTTEILGKTSGKDIAADKATFPGIFGLEESRSMAKKIYTESIENLKFIDRPTDLLAEIADHILDRTR